MNEKYLEVVQYVQEMQDNLGTNSHRVTILMCEKIIHELLLTLSKSDSRSLARAVKRNDFKTVAVLLTADLDDFDGVNRISEYLNDFEGIIKQLKFNKVNEKLDDACVYISVDTVYNILFTVSSLLKEEVNIECIYPERVSVEKVEQIRETYRTNGMISTKSSKNENFKADVVIEPTVCSEVTVTDAQIIASTESVPEATGGIKEIAGERLEKEEFVGTEIKVEKGSEEIELNEDVDCDDFVEPVIMSEPKKEQVEEESEKCLETVSRFKRGSGIVRFAMTPAGNCKK